MSEKRVELSSQFESYITSPPSQSAIGRFIEGFSAPVTGLRFLNRQPHLWRYAILPITLNLLITVCVAIILVSAISWFVTSIHPNMAGDQEGAWWWFAVAGEMLVFIVLLIVCAGLLVITWKLLSGILSGYFYGQLAEQVEGSLGLAKEDRRSISFGYEVADTLIDLALLITVNGFFLSFSFVPVIGSIASLVCMFWFNTMLLGLDYFGFPLIIRGNRRMARLSFGRRNQAHTMGLGAAIFLFELIPIVGAVFLTTAAVGSVLLYRRIQSAKY